MEITDIGPVVMIDTAGMDDRGELGKKRVGRTREVIRTIDLGILVLAENRFEKEEAAIIEQLNKWEVPYLVVHTKSDLEAASDRVREKVKAETGLEILEFSSLHPSNREALIGHIKSEIPETAYMSKSMVGDVISQGDLVLLITPIDEEAPEGRLILPQVQAIRDILDNDAIALVAKEREIDSLLKRLSPKPALVITDSQVFKKADASIPDDIPYINFNHLNFSRKRKSNIRSGSGSIIWKIKFER